MQFILFESDMWACFSCACIRPARLHSERQFGRTTTACMPPFFACADAGAHNAAAQPNALLCAFHPNTPLSGNTTHKKHHYPGSAASEFPATKASCLQAQDPGCLSLGLWEAHPHASTSHLPLMPAVAGAIPAVQSKC